MYVALFVVGLFGAMAAMGLIGTSSAGAQTTCDISNFKNPDGTLDTTGYLACVAQTSGQTPQPASDCPTADVQIMASADPSTLTIGQTTKFSASGFAPDSDVQIFICSTPVNLGTFRADASGNVNANVTIPAGTVLGQHTLAAVGNRANGLSQVAYAAIVVVSAPVATSPGGTLPVTGSDSGRMVALAAALVLLGGAAVVGSMRARRPATSDLD
jgi:LPXTG-motif cell wall-anchored protein